MAAHNPSSPADLNKWFSPAQMRIYAQHPDPEALYLWDTHIAKAFLEDIQHIEALLRNRVHTSVSGRYGKRWFANPDIPFTSYAKQAIQRAEKRARKPPGTTPPPIDIIAKLNLDFWFYLFANRYSVTIWPLFSKTLTKTPPHKGDGHISNFRPPSQKNFNKQLGIIYKLRNRCAHHEHIVHHDLATETAALNQSQNAIAELTYWIDPAASRWIAAHSRVPHLRKQRP